jgi:hypothetical protein
LSKTAACEAILIVSHAASFSEAGEQVVIMVGGYRSSYRPARCGLPAGLFAGGLQ